MSDDTDALPPAHDGCAVVRKTAASLPATPGVYHMLGSGDELLYVGKAKSLKHRVQTYANLPALPPRMQRMVSQVARVEVTHTRTEAEALLLEASLVRSRQPRYNILLRDDKSFPYILVTDHPFPRIEKYRGPKAPKGRYFGPFASTGAVNQSIATLQRAFLLRPCGDTVFRNRTRPCLQYQIKRCSAPCVGRISPEAYAKSVEQATQFLSGKSRKIQEDFTHAMEEASARMAYEEAAVWRDRIEALTQVQSERALHAAGLGDADLVALHREGGHSCVQVYCVRGGRNFGNRAFFPAHAGQNTDGEILAAFLGQFYQQHTPPSEILLSHIPDEPEVLEEALTLRAGARTRLLVPERGEKHALLAQAVHNAREALLRHLSEKGLHRDLLLRVGALFGLEEAPERIEVYDNSHIMGSQPVGAMIVAGLEGFLKKAYRKFTIREPLAAGDDYAMLREVLTRRFTRLQREDDARAAWPDLVLVDGGAGQLSAALEVFEQLGIADVAIVCIAKGVDRNAGREQFFLPGREPFRLPGHDPVLHYLQRLRDEAHRFAIGAHRAKRSGEFARSPLDDIPGIGPGRRRALLRHFGSARAVAACATAELEKVPGISRAMARAIYRHFH